MDSDPRFHKLADAATAGLRVDPELRLDVRAEILGYLEDTAQARSAEGASAEESIEHAARAFGPIEAVAEDLVKANRRRMTARAVVRLALRAVLVPLAAVIALGVAWRQHEPVAEWLRHALATSFSTDLAGTQALTNMALPQEELAPDPYDLLLQGNAEGRAEARRQLRELVGDGPAFAAVDVWTVYMRAMSNREDEPGAARRALDRAEVADPDNARLNVLRAGLCLREGCGDDWMRLSCLGAAELQERRGGLAAAAEQLLLASAKPAYRTYSREITEARLRSLPSARGRDEQAYRVIVATVAPRSSSLEYYPLAQAAPLYARLLSAQGRRDEAEPYLRLWKPLGLLMMQEAQNWAEVITAHAFLRNGADASAKVYEEIGEAETAAAVRLYAKRLEPIVYRSRVQNVTRSGKEALLKYGGAWGGTLYGLVPGEGENLAEELEPARRMERIIYERIGAGLFVLVLSLILVECVVASLGWRWRSQPPLRGLYLIPGWKQALATLCAVGAPVLAYVALTRWVLPEERAYSVAYLGRRPAAELVACFALSAVLAYAAAHRHVARRCAVLGVEAPPARTTARAVAVPLLAAALASAAWLLCLTVTWRTFDVSPSGILLQGAAVAFALVQLRFVAHLFGASKRYAPFYAARARVLATLCAAGIVVLAAVVQPGLGSAERSWLRRSGFAAADRAPFEQREQERLEQAKAEIRRAAANPDRDPVR